MQIDILPVPNISGKDDSEKLNNLISYVSQLHNMLKVLLTALDTNNFTAELASKIENSVQEHQSLGEYATRAFVEEENKKLWSSVDLKASSKDLSDAVDGLESQIDEKADDDTVQDLSDSVDDLSDSISKKANKSDLDDYQKTITSYDLVGMLNNAAFLYKDDIDFATKDWVRSQLP
jgi:cell division protein FtsL